METTNKHLKAVEEKQAEMAFQICNMNIWKSWFNNKINIFSENEEKINKALKAAGFLQSGELKFNGGYRENYDYSKEDPKMSVDFNADMVGWMKPTVGHDKNYEKAIKKAKSSEEKFKKVMGENFSLHVNYCSLEKSTGCFGTIKY